MSVKPVVYRYTGAVPGTAAVITSLDFPALDSNSNLSLYPVKRGAGTVYSYVAALALGFTSDPGNAASFDIWPTLVDSLGDPATMDTGVTLKIATTCPATYIRATGTDGVSGTPIGTLYAGVVTEDFMAYTSDIPRQIIGSDVLKTSGTGAFTKFILLQWEILPAANLGRIPATTKTLRLNAAAWES